MQSPLRLIRTTRKELKETAVQLGSRGKMKLDQVVTVTEEILADVQKQGDAALLAYTKKFDSVEFSAGELQVSKGEIANALAQVEPNLLATMEKAASNIRRFHQAQLPQDVRIATKGGGYTALLHKALETVGLYVPGGSAPLPSSVLMNALPAVEAGVGRLIMCTPPDPQGRINPAILAAAHIAGITEIFKVGGAQAIAAMAYGTKTVPAVDKICGPGNIYVNMAKKLVYGQVDIDMFAGPSEILIIADQSASPEFVAADLLSQAEHDPLASALLVTDSEELAEAVVAASARRATQMPRYEIIRQSLKAYGAALVVPDIETAIEFANELAPEHLELCLQDPEKWLPLIRHAGAVFMGHFSPEPLGDYYAGPNHVLPTSGTARFFSPLNTNDFIKKTSVINYTQEDLAACWQEVAAFADAEELQAHADALRVRFSQDKYGATE